MSELDPTTTQRDLQTGLAAELAAAGFFDAEEIGRGGFGAVFRCIERSLDRLVAVKVLNSEFDGEDRARFVREQHALGRLSGHPNIVQILQADITATGKPYIVMPFHARGRWTPSYAPPDRCGGMRCCPSGNASQAPWPLLMRQALSTEM